VETLLTLITPQLILEANDRWFELTGYPRDIMYEMSWMELFKESSISILEEGWNQLTKDGMSWSAELELKKPWYDPATGDKVDYWVLADAQSKLDKNGAVRTIMGSITDITLQKRSAKDAETRARLTEQFLLRTQGGRSKGSKRQRRLDANKIISSILHRSKSSTRILPTVTNSLAVRCVTL
jgi:hypothetical protein